MTEHDPSLQNASDDDRAAYRVAARVLKSASVLTRATCPSPADLIAEPHTLGTRAASRDAHVAACPACREDLADFAVLDARPAPSLAGAIATVRGRLVLAFQAARDALAEQLELIDSTLTIGPAPALAPARGGQPARGLAARVAFRAGELQLEWGPSPRGVDLQARALGEAPRAYRLTLSRPDAGGILESRTSDSEGVAHLGGVEPGHYLLKAYGPQSRSPEFELELELKGT